MEAGRREWRTELRLSIRNLLMVPHPWLLLTESSEAELGRGRLGPVWSRAGSLHFPREGDILEQRRGDVKRRRLERLLAHRDDDCAIRSGPISPTERTPESCMARTSSSRRTSSARAAPASPAAQAP